MVPVRLALKNFLSYADDNPPLDFTQFHVACLSGNNGHGKSALLDAMTWALWGEARKMSGARSPDEGLLRLGAQEMSVELDFDLEGNRYRVFRRYRKTSRSGSTRLEFQVLEPEQDKFVPLTQAHTRQTQEKITQTLRMDYETFINSAFLLQGRADEFTRRSAGERKAILSEILGLSRYDELSQRARDRARHLAVEAAGLKARLEEMEEELKHRAAYETRLVALREQAAQCEAQLREQEEELARLRDERTALLTKRQQAEELSKRLQETERDIVSLSAQAGQQERQVRQLREVLGQKEKILADYERYQDLQEQAEEFTQSLARLNALRSQQSALQLAIERERAKVAQEQARLQSQYAAEKRNIEEAESTLQKAAEIEAGYERLQAARQEDKGWEQRRAQHETLENQRREVERQIEKARNEIQVQVNTLTRQAQELKRKADALPARKEELEKAQAAVEAIGELSARRSAAQEEFQQHTAELAALKAQKEAAEREMTALQQRLEVVRSNKDPQCPVCRQPLDERHQKEIERQIAQESENAKKSVQAVLNQGRLVRGKKDELDKRIKEWDERLKGQSAAERRMAQAQTAVEEAARALEDLKKVTEEVRALNERLEKKDFAAEEHAKLTQVTATLKEVGYDAARHQATRRALSDWQRFEAERVRLETAREQHRRVVENLPTLEAALQRVEAVLERKDYASEEQKKLIETENAMKSLYYDESAHRAAQVELRQLSDVSARKERLDSAEKSIGDMEETWQRQRQTLTEKEEQRQSWQQEQARWAEELTQLAPVEQRINAIAQAQRSGQQTRDGIVREQGEMEAKVRTVEKLAQEKVAEEERLKTLRHEQFIYEKLTVAFGRDGIPALIIENATPEIEDEANRLLSQLTDNRVQVSIEPLRDLKSGGIKETLDIKVSDELGTRPLELFSGGEAFRVDFALRIALSKLLAHRAGTRLRTLVVDEGFGTQDADGLQRMLEAINVISADFDKIVVITHLETLKNAFPARIEVVKLPDVGSKYEVVL